jgi:hypothetical protein
VLGDIGHEVSVRWIKSSSYDERKTAYRQAPLLPRDVLISTAVQMAREEGVDRRNLSKLELAELSEIFHSELDKVFD